MFIGCAFRFNGPLDIEALRASIEAVVQRHEALRTHIEINNGAIMQRIDLPGACRGYDVEVVTLNGRRREAETEARRCARQFMSDPPDWNTGPV